MDDTNGFSSTLLNQIIDNEVLEMNDYEIFESNKTTSYSVNNYKETIKFLQELHHA